MDRFPGDPERKNFTRAVAEVTHSEVAPTPVREPHLIGWSDLLAGELGIQRPSSDDPASVEILAGNRTLGKMKPYAARYGGHQFGHWAGQLGDGRAITLGEAVCGPQRRFEFQLKGAGPTPYSRRADGRAVLRSSVREFLCSEAMHSLGVPTTRALSLASTGEPVVRDMFYDGNPAAEPGAVVCRVAPSFLRFGNFQILATNGEHELLKRLTDFLIEDHYSELNLADPDVYGKLFDEIARRTAVMIAHWMRVGFVHGVMNTDNMSALGLTIDYGPYGWLEPYDPDWTPNTTDAQGRRYRFGHQASIAMWNLARLAEALLPLIGDENRVHQGLAVYRDVFGETYEKMLSRKFGITSLESEENQKLVQDLFALLQRTETDYTLFFRGLSNWPAETEAAWVDTRALFEEHIAPSLYAGDARDADLLEGWLAWLRRYTLGLRAEGSQDARRQLDMKSVNPKYVLRNYLAQNAIHAATQGDLSVLARLQKVLKTPYDELPGEEALAAKRPEWARNAPGCSALSCSS